jgi:hypothetical protein
MPTFTNASPAAAEVLANSQPLMLANNQYLQTSIGVDHNFTANTATAQDGYHKVIHFVRQAGNPAPIANVGQLFTKVGTSNTQLFYEDAAGVVTQLTTSVTPVAAANGYTFLPGGLILQWGTVTPLIAGGTPTAVLFNAANINFPNTCFNVQLTLHPTSAGGTTNAQTISVVSFSTAQFVYNYSGGSAYNRLYWVAIGN